MKRKNLTRSALFTSIISLLLCVSMLVGTTFAWFTDTVTSANNVIKSGNLDIVLEYWDGDSWEDVSGKADILAGDLWEPGYVDVAYLRMKNAGSLALKYQLGVNIVTEKEGKNQKGETFKLSDSIYYNVIEGVNGETGAFANRAAALAEATQDTKIYEGYSKAGTLAADSGYLYLAMVVHMPTTVGNEANHNGKDIPQIDLGINVYATQVEAETDSFDKEYDKDAWHDAMQVHTAQDLQAAINNGQTNIILMDDIDLTSAVEIPEGATVALNLNGKTITGGKQADPTKSVYAIANYGTLILKNGTVNARGVNNYGTLIVEDGVYNAVDNNGGAAIWNNAGSRVTINGGTFTAAQAESAPAASAMYVASGATAVVNGGTFKSDADWTYAIISNGDLTINDATVIGEHGAIAADAGKLTINDGVYEVTASGHTIYAEDAEVIINGGSFKNSFTDAIYDGSSVVGVGTASTATINGGTFDSAYASLSYNGSNITITGGTFLNKAATVYNGDFAQFVATGYQAIDNGDGTYSVIFPQESFDSLIDNAGENATIEVPAGEYSFPASDLKAGQTLYCEEGTVFTGARLNANGATIVGATFKGSATHNTVNGTYKDCTFEGSNGLRYGYAGETVVFENCVFSGNTYGVHFDSGANEVVFRNCTLSGFNAFGSEITKLTLEGCTFKSNGKSGYNGINMWGDTELKNCTFVFDGSVTYEWVDLCTSNQTVTFTNCVVTDGKTEKGIETVVGNYGTGNTITIDGVPYATSNDMLKAAVANGATKVLLADGEYDLNGNQKDGLTLEGIGNNVKVANTTKYASGKSTGAIWKAINLQNVTITNTVYTMADGGKSTFTNVNFAAGFRQGYGTGVVFTDCTFGSNSEGYALHFQTDAASEGGLIKLNGCDFEGGKVHLGGKRAYEFTECDFAEGTDFQVWSNITLDGCTVNGEKVTAENVATFFPNLDVTKVTFK